MLRIWRRDCALCIIGNEFPCRQPHNPSATLLRGSSTLPKDENRSPFHGEKPLMKEWVFGRKLYCDLSKRHSENQRSGSFGLLEMSWYIAILQTKRTVPLVCKYSGVRWRRSVVVTSIVLTITDPLRGSYTFWYYLQAALIRSCGASFACMELTIISRFQRL